MTSTPNEFRRAGRRRFNLAAAQPDLVRDMAARWQQLQDQFVRDAGPVSKVPNTKKPAKPATPSPLGPADAGG